MMMMVIMMIIMIITIIVISSISTHLKMMVMTWEGIPEEEKISAWVSLGCHLGVTWVLIGCH